MNRLRLAAAACLFVAAAAEWLCEAAPSQALIGQELSDDGGCLDYDTLPETEEAHLAWQSLVQLQTPELMLTALQEPYLARRGASEVLRITLRNASQAFSPRQRDEKLENILQLLRLQLEAAKHLAGQRFEPFPSEMRRPARSSILVADSPGEGSQYGVAAGAEGVTEVVTHGEDLWPGIHESVAKAQVNNDFSFFGSAPAQDWIVLAAVSVVLFLLDMLVIQKLADGFRAHAVTLVFWLLIALAFNAWTWVRFGRAQAFNWCTGYFLEWILSMDNLFVFHLVFETYKTPPSQTHKAVFLGIIGAVVIRMIFFMVVSTLLRAFGWIRIPFGLLLIYSGIQAAKGDDDDTDVADTWLVKTLTWALGDRLKDGYDDEGRLFVRSSSGHMQVTLLAMVVFLLELSDVVFALDSVSAKIAQIPQQYIAFSSTVIAMYGLRAMFFIIKDLVTMFELLQYGLCLILVFIGVELIASPWLKLPSGAVCILIISVFVIFTFASIARKHVGPGEDEAKEKEDGDEEPTPTKLEGQGARGADPAKSIDNYERGLAQGLKRYEDAKRDLAATYAEATSFLETLPDDSPTVRAASRLSASCNEAASSLDQAPSREGTEDEPAGAARGGSSKS